MIVAAQGFGIVGGGSLVLALAATVGLGTLSALPFGLAGLGRLTATMAPPFTLPARCFWDDRSWGSSRPGSLCPPLLQGGQGALLSLDQY